jgi:hypothetical protein
VSPIISAKGGLSSQAYGQFAASTAVAPDFGAMFPIGMVQVGSAGNSYIEFTSIPATYTHLQIRGIGRTTTGNYPTTLLYFNSDTNANYSWHQILGDGGVAVAGAASQSLMVLPPTSGSTQSTSVFGAMVIDILDYKNTSKYKTIRALGGTDNNTAGQLTFNSANWRNTNAITTVKVSPGSGNFAEFSQFALYGIL